MIVKNVLTYVGLVLIQLITVVQLHMMLPTLRNKLICLSELWRLLSQLINVPSHTQKTTMICGYNTNTNLCHDRQSYYQYTTIRNHAVTSSDCQSHVRYLLDLFGPRSNRTTEPPQTIASLTELKHQNLVIRIQGLMQATALDQNIYGVWVYSPQ